MITMNLQLFAHKKGVSSSGTGVTVNPRDWASKDTTVNL